MIERYSRKELKDIWEKQLSSKSGRFSQKTETYLKERQGASLRAFEYLSL